MPPRRGELREELLVDCFVTMPGRGQGDQDRRESECQVDEDLLPLDEPDLQQKDRDAEQERHEEIRAEDIRLDRSHRQVVHRPAKQRQRATTPKPSTPKRVQGYQAQGQGLPLSWTHERPRLTAGSRVRATSPAAGEKPKRAHSSPSLRG